MDRRGTPTDVVQAVRDHEARNGFARQRGRTPKRVTGRPGPRSGGAESEAEGW